MRNAVLPRLTLDSGRTELRQDEKAGNRAGNFSKILSEEDE